MGILAILVLSAFLLSLAYRFYGRTLKRVFQINNKQRVPSDFMNDGVDYVPTSNFVVLGHHFSSIAGAGPIVGPVLAGLYFGWLPSLIWILLGSIFIGGVHDFGSLIASVRHKATNIAEISKFYMGSFGGNLMRIFVYLALLYVVIVFLDLTALTFSQEGNVATSSTLFILLALAYGVTTKLFKVSLKKSLIIALPLLVLCIYLGEIFPLTSTPHFAGTSKGFWIICLLTYCFIASIAPVWMLLQPRDFLSSFLLYGSIIGGFAGIIIGIFQKPELIQISWPAWIESSQLQGIGVKGIGPIFPALFITVACGACSGFHSLVAAGSSSKQVKSEKSAFKIGYGAMLIEGFVAVIALCTVIFLQFKKESFGSPLSIFANGIGEFLSSLGFSKMQGSHFAFLAISTFLLTTLDTCTRLCRYMIQDIFKLDNKKVKNRYIASSFAILVPACFAFLEFSGPNGTTIPLWKAIWPIFGASNQLLAALALLSVSLWMKHTKKDYRYALYPMLFMLIATMSSLMIMLFNESNILLRTISGGLLILSFLICVQAWKAFQKKSTKSYEFKAEAS